MKNIVFYLAIILSSNTLAQDWDLFPLNQRSFYFDNISSNELNLDLVVMDSIKVVGQDKITYSRRNLNLPGAGTCYHEKLQDPTYSPFNLLYIDSFITRDDTVFFPSFFSATPFYFLPKASVGQSWTINSTYSNNDYNQITITCTSIGVQTFLGISDSIKIFSLTPNGTSANQVPVNNFVMRLSKSHGFIEYVPFLLFLFHPANTDFTSLELVGIDKNVGYQHPDFRSYFHLMEGDILQWDRQFIPANTNLPEWHEYYMDSLTHVYISPDSVQYTYDRLTMDTSYLLTQQYGLTRTFRKSEFAILDEVPPNGVGVGNNFFSGSYSVPSNNVLFWQSNIFNLNIDSVSGDTITTYTLSDAGNSIDTMNCLITQAANIYFDFTVDTRVGITNYCYYNFDSDCMSLMGSRINGHHTGTIILSADALSLKKHSALNIYPNPANDFISLSNLPNANNFHFEIFNSVGQLLKSGITGNKNLSIEDLNQGLYFIHVTTDTIDVSARFLKN